MPVAFYTPKAFDLRCIIKKSYFMKKGKLVLDKKLFIDKGIIASLTMQGKIVGGGATDWTVTACSTPQVACATAAQACGTTWQTVAPNCV